MAWIGHGKFREVMALKNYYAKGVCQGNYGTSVQSYGESPESLTLVSTVLTRGVSYTSDYGTYTRGVAYTSEYGTYMYLFPKVQDKQ